jgi:spore coat polysaccharide biosynthesis predicted glycosyltransferase SpsG
MIKVLFRADAGPGIGSGHVMRCLALAEEICANGGTVGLISAGASPLPLDWAKLNAFIRMLPYIEPGTADDLAITIAIAEEFEANWLVVDGYDFSTPWLDEIGRTIRLMYLDDLGNRNAAAALVLNQNAGAEKRYSLSYSRSQRALLGLNWFLLGSVWHAEVHQPLPRRLLITLGGGGGTATVLALMRALVEYGADFVAEVVIPACPGGVEEVFQLAQKHKEHFVIQKGPVPMPPLMRQVTVVICGGGVTPLEALSLGVVPMIVVLAENQAPGSRYLEEINAVNTVLASENGLKTAARLALNLMDDERKRQAMLENARGLVDGKGAKRVLEAMIRK